MCVVCCRFITCLSSVWRSHTGSHRISCLFDELGIDWFVDVSASLVDLVMKLGCMDYSRKLSDHAPVRDTVSWHVLIFGYSRNGYALEALKVFVEMVREGFSPSVGMVVGFGSLSWP
ncbi:hypothetical protein MLD38_001756 [Melastoma candidum]|uniref:Uncharacterized protein n=1 Tax=Melastoma candidum TaxID=119954 RepID=A0ACB9SF90_9MYRT|nr:hypothetical protein MLD38_001756 [Melastoma candidum]